VIGADQVPDHRDHETGMGSASTIKPEAGVVTAAYTRPAPAEVQQAVATELPAANSVTAPAAAAASK
jgi:hypothetical protein